MSVNEKIENCGLSFHHIGLAVKDPQSAQLFLEAIGYRIPGEVFDPLQNTQLIFCHHEKFPSMELVYGGGVTGDNPLKTVLDNTDQSFYHICYSTKNLETSLSELKKKNVRLICVSPPKPAILFGGKKVSFYFVKAFGLIEILEDPGE